jgi:rubrerythrin
MPEKKYWRCTVCHDFHYGAMAPELCPTCKQSEKYVEATKEELMQAIGL